MKKLFLLLCFFSISTFVFSQTLHRGRTEVVAAGTVTYTLCSATGTTCGCTSSCSPAICDSPQSSNCARDAQTLTLDIPADFDVTVAVASEGCGSTSGLDGGDFYSVNGTQYDGASNTTPTSSECFFTIGGAPASLDVVLDANRVDECISVTVTAVANGGVAGDGIPGCSVPLPVDLVSFNAKLMDSRSVDINWSTASEENNSHFEVEYSINGRDFTSLGKVDGAGTSSQLQEYNFVHHDASAGTNYYRLRQVDFDGAFEYSSVEVITIHTEAVIEIRPTMVLNSVQIVLEEGLTTDIDLQIVDITGRQLQTGTIAKGTEQFHLNVNELDKGAYFIQFNVAGEVITRRFVKM